MNVDDFAFSPGVYLRDELAQRGMTLTDLAERMGRPLSSLSRIVNAQTTITPATALQLEQALDISAEMWLNLEAQYRLRLARFANERAREGRL
jgi:HTH-type transcriptional regulator / antitoxin HigA